LESNSAPARGGGEHGEHRRGGDEERDGAGRDRRVEVGAQLGVDRALDREDRPGGESDSGSLGLRVQQKRDRGPVG